MVCIFCRRVVARRSNLLLLLRLDGKGHSLYIPPPEAAALANATALHALPDRRAQAGGSGCRERARPGQSSNRIGCACFSALASQVRRDAGDGLARGARCALMELRNERLFKRKEQAVQGSRGGIIGLRVLALGWGFQEAPGEPTGTAPSGLEEARSSSRALYHGPVPVVSVHGARPLRGAPRLDWSRRV